MTPYELSPDGIELQACNGTGHFALTMCFLPILKKTASSPNSHVRIVNVSSLGHTLAARPDFSSVEGLNLKSGSDWGRYSQSKLTVGDDPIISTQIPILNAPHHFRVLEVELL